MAGTWVGSWYIVREKSDQMIKFNDGADCRLFWQGVPDTVTSIPFVIIR